MVKVTGIKGWLKSDVKDDEGESYHCAEFITTILDECGHKCYKNPVLMTPQDVTDFSCYGPIEEVVEKLKRER